jgi:hypothetical protein
MLIMASIIRVGQSKFVTHPIDEDSQERIMNCLNTLSDLDIQPIASEVFLDDTKAAYSKMLSAQEVGGTKAFPGCFLLTNRSQKKAAEKKEAESPKEVTIQVDDLLSFRQLGKKGADDMIDVRPIIFISLASTYRRSMTRMSVVPPALRKFGRTLSQTLAISHSSRARIARRMRWLH